MIYHVARDGQLSGPYSLLQLQRHIASGHVLESDLAQAEGADEWVPVGELFPAPPPHQASVNGPRKLYPDPPNLKWWIALLLGIVTFGAFFVVWDVVEAAWMRRVAKANLALILYSLAMLLYMANLPAQVASISHSLFNGPPVEAPFALTLSLADLAARLVARFVLRANLLRHFNQTEPLGLKLNWWMTLLFSGLYFQYQFNCINDKKRALRLKE